MTNSVEPPLPVRTGRTRSDCRAAPVSHNQVRQREQHIQFGRPRYRVFRYRNCPFMTANTCSTLALTDDFLCSAFFALLCPLANSFLICVGLRFCLYLIFLPCLFRTMASCRFSAPIYPLSPYKFTSSCKNDIIICLFIPLLLQHILARFSMLLFYAGMP